MLSAVGDDEAIQLFSTSPALFVENAGQWADESVRYLHQGDGVNVAMTDAGPVFQLFRSEDVETDDADPGMADVMPEDRAIETLQISATFDGADLVTPIGLDQSETVFNYFVGDEANWREGVTGYATVAYENLYDGIDLHAWGQRDSLKYEFHVAPGSDWRQIAVSHAGIEGLSIDTDGSLRVDLPGDWADLVDDAPYIYQVVDGEQVEVAGRFALVDADSYAFEITGQYDADLELIVDPDLQWATYLGGSGADNGWGVAVDGGGSILVTGHTRSTNFAGASGANHGDRDAFLAKVSAGGILQWATYLGGSGQEYVYGIAVDGGGSALVTGGTNSTDFAGASGVNHGAHDAFVAKVSAGGILQWATYLGGSGSDNGEGIAVDGGGSALVTGNTVSTDFAGATGANHGGGFDAFVAKVSPAGTLQWATYLGGSSLEFGYGVAVDGGGSALVTGGTHSINFAGASGVNHGDQDAFVAKVSAGGTLQWATYLGGSGYDHGYGVAVDGGGSALVTGYTSWGDFAGATGEHHRGTYDAFLVKVSPTGTLQWATYLGGSGSDHGYGVAVDGGGSALVTGETDSINFAGASGANHGGSDAFVAKVSAGGTLQWATYLGGSGGDYGRRVAVDGGGSALVTGSTSSTDFAGAVGANHGGSDAFVAKLTIYPPGDFDGDGQASQSDLTMLLAHWGAVVRPAEWIVPFDGFVDQNELNELLSNWDEGATATARPAVEPLHALRAGENDEDMLGPLSARLEGRFDRHAMPDLAVSARRNQALQNYPWSVGGSFFLDDDGNGGLNVGEEGFQDPNVYTIYLDVDLSGDLSPGDILPTTTTADGSFEFLNIDDGQFPHGQAPLSISLNPDWTLTRPRDRSMEPDAIQNWSLDPTSGLAVGDFDGDTDLDVIVGHGSDLALLRNDGGELVLEDDLISLGGGDNAYGVESAHLNGDTHLDLIVTTLGPSGVSILHGNGDGTFTVAETHLFGVLIYTATSGDFDGDGDTDVAIGEGSYTDSPGKLRILRNRGDGTFVQATPVEFEEFNPHDLVAVHMNDDDDVDLLVANLTDEEQYGGVSLLLNNGSGGYETKLDWVGASITQVLNTSELAVADFDGDGDLDVAAANFGGCYVEIFTNMGDGVPATGTEVCAFVGHPFGVVADDVDRDGDFDLLVGVREPSPEMGGTVVHVLSNVSGVDGIEFVPKSPLPIGPFPEPVAWSLRAGDFDGDGFPEAVLADGEEEMVSLFNYIEVDSNYEFPERIPIFSPYVFAATPNTTRWSGPDGDWSVESLWTTGTPNARVDAVIESGRAMLAGLAASRSLTIGATGALTLDDSAQLAVAEDLSMDASSEIAWIVGDAGAGQIIVTGTASLDGVLDVSVFAPLDAAGPQTITIVQAGGLDGTAFDATPTPGEHLGHGVIYQGVVYDETSVTLTLLQTVPGDFNGDTAVDQSDLNLLLGNWGETAKPAAWTGPWDGSVDQNELNDLLSNWGTGVASTTTEGTHAVDAEDPALHDAALKTTDVVDAIGEQANRAADALWYDYCQQRKDEKRIVGPRQLDPMLLNVE